MKSIIFKDQYNYCYLYSFGKKKLLQITPEVYNMLDVYWAEGECWEGDSIAARTCSFFDKYGFLDFDNIKVGAGIDVEDIEYSIASVPVITFELTQKCNLGCKYCVYGDLYETEKDCVGNELSFDVAKSVIDFCLNKGMRNQLSGLKRTITIGFYGGEPLLRFDLVQQIISYTKSRESEFLTFTYNMTTNAVLLDKYMDYIVEQDISLLISLDGDKKASSYRTLKSGRQSYDRVYSNIRELKKRHFDFYVKNVSFNAVLHDQNELSSLLHFYHHKLNKVPMISTLATSFVKKNAFGTFNHMYRGLNSEALCLHNIPIDDYLKLNPSLITLSRFYEAYSGYFYKTFKELVNDYEYVNYVPGGACIPFTSKLFVSADGKVHPCERVGYKYSLGYVNDKNEFILNLKEVVERYNSYYDILRPKCTLCYRIQSCPKCFLQHDINCAPVSRKDMTSYICDMVNVCHKFRNHLKLPVL